MGLLNLMAIEDVAISIYNEIYTVPLNWIGEIIKFLVGAVGIGFGIILFSLILKFITLPFDIYQRISMRKQNLKMKENQGRMEKLQKQYANDKDMYNKKVMEMYKENGLSTFSSCLPMILSMVIFFVAINAFNQYSAYGSMQSYNRMVETYNGKMIESVEELNDENISWKFIENEGKKPTSITITVNSDTANDKYIYYTVNYGAKEGEIVEKEGVVIPEKLEEGKTLKDYYDLKVGFDETTQTYDLNGFIKNYIGDINDPNVKLEYFIDGEELYNSSEENKTWIDERKAQKLDKLKEEERTAEAENTALTESIKEFFILPAQAEVKKAYETDIQKETKFLWIKNIWVTDAMYKHPVMPYDEFSTLIAEKNGCSCGKSDSPALKIDTYKETAYNEITGALGTQKSSANGYFILIALSIGTILLQQFVSMRSQKEQQKYSSVDGQNGGQQKMMMIMMTGMFAIFSFLYSSAFSIYLIVSNLFAMLSTLVINKVVDKVAEKKEEKAEKAKYERRFTHTAKQEKKLKSVKIKEDKTDKKSKK